MFTPLTFEQVAANAVCVDKDPRTGLQIYSYEKCCYDSSDLKKRCRGIVVDKNNDIVMEAFGFTPELTSDDEQVRKFLTETKDYKFYESKEGTIVRVFFNTMPSGYETMFVSTHRKLNAATSYWSSDTSFGNLFRQGIERLFPKNGMQDFKKKLNTDYQYMFLISSTHENRIVCEAPKKVCVYHVGTYTGPGKLDTIHDVGVPKPVELEFGDYDADKIIEYVENLDTTCFQGIVAFAPNNQQFKILNKHYKELYDIRANRSDVVLRYLELCRDEVKLPIFMSIYPNLERRFKSAEQYVQNQLIYYLHDVYIGRHIRKEVIKLDAQEHYCVKECHKWYRNQRSQGNTRAKVTRGKVREIFEQQVGWAISKMLVRYYNHCNRY